MNEQEARALWDRVEADFQRNSWVGAVVVALAPQSPLLLAFYSVSYHQRTAGDYPNNLMICGLPTRIDPTLPPDELRLERADGTFVRMINIGTGEP